MYLGKPIQPPLFEVGLKGYLWGDKALELAKAADEIAERHGVTVLLTPQLVDIARLASQTHNIWVIAPHLDPLRPGRGSGSVLAEAVKHAGADGALLNHAEKPVTLDHIARAIERADEVGLITIVCADSPAQAAAIAHLGPNIILAEPPELIGGSASVATQMRQFIADSISAVKRVDPRILVLNSAGIRQPQDAAAVIAAGADGTGCTSGVVCADDPIRALDRMVEAVRGACRRKT